jgi:uncharacterized protein
MAGLFLRYRGASEQRPREPHLSTLRLRHRLPLMSVPVLLLMATAVCLALEVPYLSGRVVDDAEILSPEARERITELSRQHQERTGNQLAVLTVTTLESESIEDYAVQVFENWKLGQQGKDNGVLLVIAPQERRVRIEVGYGLEGTLPDAIASRIIRNSITPQFKNGNYDAGVVEGVRVLTTVLEGDAPPAAQSTSGAATADDTRFRKRVLAGGIIFGLLGVFTLPAVLAPGSVGWFFYVFMLPFWVMFPLGVLGFRRMLMVVGGYLVVIAVIRMLLSRSGWYQRRYDSRTNGAARVGGLGSRSSSSRVWSSGRSRRFSGGGGRSGGGGASGRW